MGELVEWGALERMACRAVGLSRSSYRYQPQRTNVQESERVKGAIVG